MGLWTESFFNSVGNKLGSYVMSDTTTLSRYRADYARILVKLHHPLLHCFTMSVDVGGTSSIILVEKDATSYDHGSVMAMPSTPVKIYNSEDDNVSDEEDEEGDDRNNDFSQIQPEPHEKDYESAVEIDSDEEDEVFRNAKLDGLRSGVYVQPAEMEGRSEVAGHEGSPAAKVSPLALSVNDSLGAAVSNLNSNGDGAAMNSGAEVREQLQDLIEAGYTLQELEVWRNNIKADGILEGKKQILDNKFQNPVNYERKFEVTGYSFNFKDLFLNNNFLPNISFYWDPQNLKQLQGARTCLPSLPSNQNHLFGFATSLTTSTAPEAKRETQDVFVRTSPNQIVRQTLACIQENHETPKKFSSVPSRDADSALASPVVKKSPNTDSSKKSSQRGRPKGSKNKPEPLPDDFLEPVQGEDGVTTRAQRTWLLGKQLGLKPRGSEALMLRGLEAQIRQNHPHLK
ncbi:uncharacterized protein LOC130723370 [Lotus japonicus]|uniref:uncharacterized protein LOC130723370 n=1 Tax=Lotus japonicus TaxID=34305 RepID=UPI002589FAD5|nr:uncharacterized protein LOC130723370 [Lotus japonicus]